MLLQMRRCAWLVDPEKEGAAILEFEPAEPGRPAEHTRDPGYRSRIVFAGHGVVNGGKTTHSLRRSA